MSGQDVSDELVEKRRVLDSGCGGPVDRDAGVAVPAFRAFSAAACLLPGHGEKLRLDGQLVWQRLLPGASAGCHSDAGAALHAGKNAEAGMAAARSTAAHAFFNASSHHPLR